MATTRSLKPIASVRLGGRRLPFCFSAPRHRGDLEKIAKRSLSIADFYHRQHEHVKRLWKEQSPLEDAQNGASGFEPVISGVTDLAAPSPLT